MSKEYNFSDRDFQHIKQLVLSHTGICLSDIKKDMIYSRLVKRLRKLGIPKFKSYLELISDENSEEIGNFINAVTTNLTSFFRENHHFEYLKNTLVPQLLKENSDTRKIRIWSAGCSTGEEPYSLAITLKESVPENQGWDVRILATDLDTNVLATASEGVYTLERVNGLPSAQLKKWFVKGKGRSSGMAKASSELQDMIIFKQLNLMKEWPVRPGVDVIFCRNVVIYFDKQTQARLFERYADILKASGHLFIGHSENLHKVSNRFNLLGNTIYQKAD